jgi:hypothetical protein
VREIGPTFENAQVEDGVVEPLQALENIAGTCHLLCREYTCILLVRLLVTLSVRSRHFLQDLF